MHGTINTEVQISLTRDTAPYARNTEPSSASLPEPQNRRNLVDVNREMLVSC